MYSLDFSKAGKVVLYDLEGGGITLSVVINIIIYRWNWCR